jgi:hypothetical protein
MYVSYKHAMESCLQYIGTLFSANTNLNNQRITNQLQKRYKSMVTINHTIFTLQVTCLQKEIVAGKT